MRMIFLVFVRRFVAGESIDDAVKMAHRLKQKNIYAIINILGEHVRDEQEAIKLRDQYADLIFRLYLNGLSNTHISVKPSQLGLEISESLYENNLREILRRAMVYLPNSLVEIDREGRGCSKSVRKISLALARYFSNQRLACQINLYETPGEIQTFIKAGISIRLCKGAYPGDIKDEKEIRKIFLEQAFLLEGGGNPSAIATHDPYLIDKLRGRIKSWQVLLGIENKIMEGFASGGDEVGFYVPCGPNWWSYGKRRARAILKIWSRNRWYRIRKGGER